MARKSTNGMLGAGGGLFAAHNQGVNRGAYQGERGSGFFVEFLGAKEVAQFEQALEEGALAIEKATVEAAIATGDELKQKLRGALDSAFQGSAPTRNSHRRATNAMVQSATYNTIKGEPGFTYLLYSKLGRGKGPDSFVDYLLAHLHGRSMSGRPWFRIAVSPDAKALQARGGRFEVGNFPGVGTKVFMRRSKRNPANLLLLRQNTRTGKTQLLEVLLKSVTITPKLGGMLSVLEQAEATFDRHADEAWARHSGGSAS